MTKIIGNINGITLNQALYNQVQPMWKDIHQPIL